MSHLEMTKEEVANTMMVYNKVRKGGPKDKRIRRVELMGEHTPKPLHWIKVTQSLSDPLVPIDHVITDLQSTYVTHGLIYTFEIYEFLSNLLPYHL